MCGLEQRGTCFAWKYEESTFQINSQNNIKKWKQTKLASLQYTSTKHPLSFSRKTYPDGLHRRSNSALLNPKLPVALRIME
mmetsp:Transcript_31855/g.42343  ORF Transcript_31855/g.42343 Transcript_31855/m.42343 type:complete len:81 (+) Transcript_31855:53-295(+)